MLEYVPLQVEQLVDSGRGFLVGHFLWPFQLVCGLTQADTILFLVFYAPTIDNREAGVGFKHGEEECLAGGWHRLSYPVHMLRHIHEGLL